MRIVFDGTSLRPGPSAAVSHADFLIRHLAVECADDEICVVSNRTGVSRELLPPNVRVIESPSPLPHTAWMQLVAPRLIGRLGANLAHFTGDISPLMLPVPSVLTIAEAQVAPRVWSSRLSNGPTRVVRPLIGLAARRAAAVITGSENARQQIARTYGIDPVKIHVVCDAVAPAFSRMGNGADLDRVRERYRLADRIILCGATSEPRRDLPVLIDAFARSRAAGALRHQLVCMGRCGWLSQAIEDRIEELHIEDAITFTGDVPADDRRALYSLAEMFVVPSADGFGASIMEAMACGTPVIAGRAPELSDLGGGAIEQVDRVDAESLGAAIVSLTHNADRRARLGALAAQRSQAFSWQRTARATRDVYVSVLASGWAATHVAVRPANPSDFRAT